MGSFYFTTDEWMREYMQSGVARKPISVKNKKSTTSPRRKPVRFKNNTAKRSAEADTGFSSGEIESRFVRLDGRLNLLERRLFRLSQDLERIRNDNYKDSSSGEQDKIVKVSVSGLPPQTKTLPKRKTSVDSVVKSVLLDELWSRPRGVFLSYLFAFLLVAATFLVINPLLIEDLKLLGKYIITSYSNISSFILP